MQKVLSRAARAAKQADRRRALAKEKDIWAETKYYRASMIEGRSNRLADRKRARKEAKEDWFLGTLAPNRAGGKAMATYGAFDQQQVSSPEVPEHMRRKEWPIVEGDRVVILKGKDKGKIGKVRSVYKEQENLTVEGMNRGYIAVDEWQSKYDADDRPIREHNLPIPYDDVQLVATITDPRTERPSKDVIVEKVDLKPLRKDITTGEQKYRRFVHGTNIEIPYPYERDPDHTDNDADTLRITVEERTFIPTLLIPPMPESVIDELRGKYSKFRTRHDEDFIEKVGQLDREGEHMQELAMKMRTPLQEFHAIEKEKKALRPEPQLTEDMLERIGALMAVKKQRQQQKEEVSV